MKHTLLFLFAINLFNIAQAKKYDTLYFNTNDIKSSAQDYEYYRLITKIKKKLFSINDFYNDGSIKSVGFSNSDKKPQWYYQYDKTGTYEVYYKGTNKIFYSREFINGYIKEGSLDKTYFKNGQLYKVDSLTKKQEFVISVYDRKGNILVSKGSGQGIIYEPSLIDSEYKSIGNFIDGAKDSIWISRSIDSGKAYYNEKYNNGNFTGGISFDSIGKAYKYKEIKIYPSYGENNSDLNDYMGKEIKYPAVCRDKGIQGTVYVRFTIEEDGSIINAYALNKKHPDLEREAIRLIDSMDKKWSPKILRGQKQKITTVFPINFRIR